MATCNLRFYRTNITPDKNRCYDPRGLSLLATMTSATLIYSKDNFQYQKISLRMSIKVSFSQNVQFYQNVNYLSLWDVSTQREYFFYIVKFEWMAQNTIKCELYLDTIQTFRQQILDNITASSYVMREHSDRARALTGGGYKRIISKTDEGVGVISQELLLNIPLNITSNTQKSTGYMAYSKTASGDSSALSIMWFSDGDHDVILNDHPTQSSLSLSTLQQIDLIVPPSTYNGILILDEDSPDLNIIVNGTPWNPWSETKIGQDGLYICKGIYICNSNLGSSQSEARIYLLYYKYGSDYPYDAYTSQESVMKAYSLDIYNVMYIRRMKSTISNLDTNYAHLTSIVSQEELRILEYGTTFRNVKLATRADFDFSDSYLMKVIETPFFPPSFHTSAHSLMSERLPDGYVFNFHYRCLQKRNINLHDETVQYNPITIGVDSSFYVYTNTSPKQITNESKLYNSAFYTCKFVYGSDSKEIKLENFSGTSISILAWPPNNMSSTILFDFNLTTSTYKGLDDYFRYMTTTRNNERVVYNSSYLDYMRLQYTSDRANIKQNQDQKIASLAGSIASSTAGAVAGVAGGFMAGASAGAGGGPIGAIIGGVIGLTTAAINIGLSASNTNNSIQQENRNFSSKLATLSAQSVSVSGNVDIDILDLMNLNSLNFYIYQAPDHIRQQLFDKFYYTGYAVGYRKMPDFTSRHNFNFVQCVPVFNNSEMFVAKEFLDDIMERFASGVTFMHPVTIDGIMATFDENQVYENMEVSLL